MKKYYIKKPLMIEAIQFDGSNPDEIKEFVGDKCKVEYEFDIRLTTRSVRKAGEPQTMARITIHTLEGDMKVSPGDYVIRGVEGEFYPCKGDIFEKTYQNVPL